MWTSKRSKDLALSHAQLESVILERTAELQVLSQRLLRVQDDERRKLARDLHDGTGQTLAALQITVSFLQDNCGRNPETASLVAELAALAQQASDEVRTMSYLLHPPLLDEVGFACAAEWYLDGFARRSRIAVTSELSGAGKRLPRNVEIALFRVLQESLTNVHRHSGASEVRVLFQRHAGGAVLEIHDFGHGIPAERLARLRQTSADSGIGLTGMRERMKEFNGKFEMESDGNGTTMRATIPISALLAHLDEDSDSRHRHIPQPDLAAGESQTG
jgi:signal transduction histidine kinase